MALPSHEPDACQAGRGACQVPGTRRIEGVVDVQNAFTIHPSALGMRNDARQILAVLKG